MTNEGASVEARRARLDRRLELRVSDEDIAAWRGASRRVGIRGISEWARRTLNAAAPDAGSAENVEESRLPNGVRVVTARASSAPHAAIGILVDAGVTAELENEHGLAWIGGRLAFEGAGGWSASEIARRIDEAGGHFRARVETDFALYTAHVAPEQVPAAIELLGVVLRDPADPEAAFDQARRAALSELAAIQDHPALECRRRLRQGVWPAHALGRPSAGSAAALESMDREHLAAFRRRCNAPHSMIVAAAGPISHAEIVDAVRASLAIPLAPDSAARTPSAPPAFGRIQSAASAPGLSQSYFALGCPAAPAGSLAGQALYLAFSRGHSARLRRFARQFRGGAAHLQCGYSAYRDGGILTIEGAVEKGQESRMREALREQLLPGGPGAEPFTSEEIWLAQIQMRAAAARESREAPALMLDLGLRAWYGGRPAPLEERLEEIDRVTADAVNQLARESFSSEWAAVWLQAE